MFMLEHAMAQPPPQLGLEGPPQFGRGVKGQYVYWIVMAQPTQEVVQRAGVKQPADFSRSSFSELVVKCHDEGDEKIIETAIFLEPHANATFHLNALVRAERQYHWKPVAERFLQVYKVRVSCGQNVKN